MAKKLVNLPFKKAKVSPMLQQKAKPVGNPTMKWAPKKKPVEMATDRGTFGFK